MGRVWRMRAQFTRGGPGGGQLTCRTDLEGVRRRVTALIDERATRAAGSKGTRVAGDSGAVEQPHQDGRGSAFCRLR